MGNNIKANEFRIGNVVLLYGLKHRINLITDCEYNNLELIPLTEEWLLNMGFTNITGTEWEIPTGGENNTSLTINIRDFSFSVGYAYESSGTPFKIQFVHQLQNLYFAVTGEELIIR